MGRKQYISTKITNNLYISPVKSFKRGGAYIPLPKECAGRIAIVELTAKVILMQK